MALADIVLEGLTLILVIALGAVLIGGLSYLATTTVSANNARLIEAGTYVYLPGPTYINNTLYIPMYNIGKYTVYVKYLFVKGVNGVQEYTTNMILKPGQYYVYELSIDYTPEAVTIVVSPINDPRLALEFSSNVTTPKPIALTPISTSLSAQGCPVLASVNDPYNAGWRVTWTMAGGTYSISESSSYQWCILPPYYPITVNFQSTITQNPTGYQCSINPQTTQVNYEGKPETQSFTVTCTSAAYIVIEDYYYGSFNEYGWYLCGDPVKYTINYWGNATGTLSGQVPCIGVNGQYNITYAIPTNGTIYWNLASVKIPSGTTCIISPTSGSVNPGQVSTITFSCLYWPYNSGGNNNGGNNGNYYVYVTVTGDSYGVGWSIASSVDTITGTGNVNMERLYIGGLTDTLTASITSNPSGYTCTISPSSVYASWGSDYTFTVTCRGQGQPPPPPSNNYFVYVTVKNDTLSASWQVSSSVKSISGSGNVNNEQLPIGGQTDTLTALITSNPSGYQCSIRPSSTQATDGSSYTFTVNCVQSGQSQPPPPKYYCIVTPSASDNVNGASGAYVSPSTTQYIPPGQSVIFTWAIRNNPVPPDYYFNNWVVTLNGQTVKTDQTSSTYYDFQCPSNLSSNQTYTLSGTAYYWERYLKVGGGNTFNVPGNGTYPITSQYTTAYFYWSDPLFISGSWNIDYQAGGATFTISVQLNDAYSQTAAATPLSASTTLAIAGPTGYLCSINSISPTSGSITSAKASNWLPTSAQVSVTCVPQGKIR